MHPSRNTILTVCIALSILGIASAIKGIQQNENRTKKEIIPVSSYSDIPETVDQSFFENDISDIPINSFVDSIVVYDGITAKAYIVGNVETGEIYAERKSGTVLPVASMSKLLTAIVALDFISPTTTVLVSTSSTLVTPDTSGIHSGESFEMKELLYPLLLNSSNIAAEALARHFGRDKFMELMRGYAWEVGASLSFFADPSGLSVDNKASARGLFDFAKYLYAKRDDVLEITRSHMSIATSSTHGAHNFVSIHPFATDSRFIGGKTGRTGAAGETMMTILKLKKGNIVIIVLGSAIGSRENDTRLLINKVEK